MSSIRTITSKPANAARWGFQIENRFRFPSGVKRSANPLHQGPVVLVSDALCYSTTDIFVAGFQDNEDRPGSCRRVTVSC